jgi:single-strand DNA-binding protein
VLQGFNSVLTMLDSRGAGAGAGAGAQAGMHEDDQAGYASPTNGTSKRPAGGGKGFDKPVDDEIPF